MRVRRFGILTDGREAVLSRMVRVGTSEGIPLFFTPINWVIGTVA